MDVVDRRQLNGWIQNFIVPYANHLRSRGLYLVLSVTGPINVQGNGSRNTYEDVERSIRL